MTNDELMRNWELDNLTVSEAVRNDMEQDYKLATLLKRRVRQHCENSKLLTVVKREYAILYAGHLSMTVVYKRACDDIFEVLFDAQEYARIDRQI